MAVPVMLKPFLPQLQRTFIKCLTESDTQKIGQMAESCLGLFIDLQPRLDPLASELCTSVKSVSDSMVRDGLLRCLAKLLSSLSNEKTLTPANKIIVMEILEL